MSQRPFASDSTETLRWLLDCIEIPAGDAAAIMAELDRRASAPQVTHHCPACSTLRDGIERSADGINWEPYTNESFTGFIAIGSGQSSVDTGHVTDSSQQRVTGVCPNCEAAARERDKYIEAYAEKEVARYDAEQEANQAQREITALREQLRKCIIEIEECDALNALCERQAALLSRVAVVLRGPEPPLTKWSHADLPERAERAVADAAHYRRGWADSVIMHTDAVTQRDDLRARLEALCIEMETDDRAGKLAHWVGAIRAELRKEAAGISLINRVIDQIEEYCWTQDGPMSAADDDAIDLLKECREAAERALYAKETK